MIKLLMKWWMLLTLLFHFTQAKRNLEATALVTCMENSQISASSFDVVFNPDDRSLHYNLNMVTSINSYVNAEIEVYAYGFKFITKELDVCSLGWKQFCPVHPGNIEIESVEYIANNYVNMIPGIAYHVPDIDAYVHINVYNNVSERLACLEIFFSNGRSVAQTGVKWATAVIAGIGLLLSAVLSTFGNSTAASHISANTMSLFLYFQSVAVISMQHVHKVPPLASAWSENLAWSMGLIKIHFMQKIFRWFVESTGGTPSLYLTATTMSVLTQRSLDYLYSYELVKRAANVLYGNENTLIFRGIKRVAYDMGMENTAVVCTGFTFFVLCGYVLAGFIMICKYGIEVSTRAGWIKPDRFVEFRQNWRIVLKGALLRYIYIGFTQLTILSFWEFTERDSAAVIVIACLFLILAIGLMLWAAYRTWYFAQKSIQIYNNPAALLYGDERVLHKYGFFYTMFNSKYYWWNFVLLSYILVKSLFIGFAQASGKTQVLATWILDMAYLGAVIHYKPYLDRPTNIVNICISLVTTVNSFLFLFFSDLFGQPYAVSAIMAWVFFIMNAAFSFILLMLILVFTALAIFSKNPDLRFKPAKDDRTSFQRRSVTPGAKGGIAPSIAEELMALGDVAKDHASDWESQLNRRETPENIFLGSDEEDDEKAGYMYNNESNSQFGRKPTLKDRLLGKLTGANKSTSALSKNSNTNYASNASSSSNNTTANKSYPGVTHERINSVSNNGLMDSFEDDEQSRFESPAINRSVSFDRSFTDNANAPNGTMQRDYSLDSVSHNPHATQSTDILNNNHYL